MSMRSPMAEAIARHFFGKEIYFASAGVRQGKLDPFVTAVMDEIGIDLQKHKPHTFEDLEDSILRPDRQPIAGSASPRARIHPHDRGRCRLLADA